MNRSRRPGFSVAALCLAARPLSSRRPESISPTDRSAYQQSAASSGLSPMADISPGIAFVAMTPCLSSIRATPRTYAVRGCSRT